MVKHTQTIYQLFEDELRECVWPGCGVGALKVKQNRIYYDFFAVL